MRITGQALKQRGTKALECGLKNDSSVIIQVRGNDSYVVLPITSYNKFREYELIKALEESRKDIKNDNYHQGSVENHIKRIAK